MYVDVKQGFCVRCGGEHLRVRQFEMSLASSVKLRSACVYECLLNLYTTVLIVTHCYFSRYFDSFCKI